MSRRVAYQSLILLTLAFVQVYSPLAIAQETPGKNKAAKPDFRNPPRQYEDVTIGDRTFVVEAQLMKAEPQLARRSLIRLKKNIDLTLEILPAHSHPFVAKQQFWMMYGPKATAGGKKAASRTSGRGRQSSTRNGTSDGTASSSFMMQRITFRCQTSGH